MSVNTNYSSTTGSPGSPFATVIKRRAVPPDAANTFAPAQEPQGQAEVKAGAQNKRPEAVISDTEKQYFEGLFPSAAGEIRSYSPYQKNGARQSAGLGTLVDVKG
jgi:hypothetical protein